MYNSILHFNEYGVKENDVGILNELLSVLDKENLLGHLVIIGSWAEYS